MTNKRIMNTLKKRKGGSPKAGVYKMTEKRLNNTIYLMYIVTKQYCQSHDISTEEFAELDKRHNILHYVSECPDVFDYMTRDEMVEEVDRFCAQA